jgi:uncharacterized protein YbjT (DUF2867 family)
MIVVTTPTGAIGHQVLNHLLDAGEAVRVIIRDPSKIPASQRSRVEIIEGSHGDPEVVERAFKGADAVFWLLPPDPRAASLTGAYLDFTRPAAMAMKALGVKRVVIVTALGRHTELAQEAGYVTASLAMDDLIAGTGIALRALAMPSFMDNILRQADSIRDRGVFFSPISGNLKLPICATRDIAAVAVRWLLDESWNGQKEVPVLGPENISFEDMANIISDVLGMPVSFQQISFEAYHSQFLKFGFSQAMAQGMTDMARAKDRGLDLGVVRTPENSTSTSFRQWCEEILRPLILNGERAS